MSFYHAVMDSHRFKFLLKCIRFDNWYTFPERKAHDKSAAISEIWIIFLRSIYMVLIRGECITVDEQLIGYRGRVLGRSYIPGVAKLWLFRFLLYLCTVM